MAEMKQLREIAESYYEASSPEMKAMANDFFESMDDDRDNKVDLEEFLTFMKGHGYAHMRNSSFFKVLDETGHGALSFMDVMTLYYIIKSGRPFCDSCAAFIPGIFFSCVHCFNANPKSAFDICHHCYKSKTCKHSHGGGHALFLDNYTLLQATRHSSTAPTISLPQTTLSRSHGQSPREDISPVSSSLNHGKSSREEVLTVSASDDFATSVIKNTFNKVVAQSQSDDRPMKRSASKNVATPSGPITSRRRTTDTAPSTAIVPATRPPKKGMWTEVASASFKALDKLIVVGNLVGVIVTTVSSCTIM